MTPGPSPIDRKLYGDLADDIILLRSDGRIVSRFKGGFRIDASPEIFSAAQVRAKAVVVRARRGIAKDRLVAARKKPKTADETPPGERAGTACGPSPAPALAKYTCEKCGGPRSKWSVALCRGCYVPKGRAPDAAPGTAARIMALECEVDALKSTVERMRVQLAMEHGR